MNALICRTLQYVKKKLSSSEFLITCLSGLKIFKTKKKYENAYLFDPKI